MKVQKLIDYLSNINPDAEVALAVGKDGEERLYEDVELAMYEEKLLPKLKQITLFWYVRPKDAKKNEGTDMDETTWDG